MTENQHEIRLTVEEFNPDGTTKRRVEMSWTLPINYTPYVNDLFDKVGEILNGVKEKTDDVSK